MAVAPVGNLVQVQNFANDNSNKLFTVPENRQWHLISVFVKLVTSGDAGNRQVDLLVLDTLGNLMGKYQAGAVQIATRTQYFFFAPNHPQDTAFTPAATNGVMLRQISDAVWLTAGMSLRVWDSAAIAATADDLSVSLLVDERSV